MDLPPKEKRVLVWLEAEEYPFVGYWDDKLPGEGIWKMEVNNLQQDIYRNDVFGEVVAWCDLIARPVIIDF